MFSPEQIQARLREKPFRPLRIIASEGVQHVIERPDMVMVGTRDLMIGYSNRKRRPDIYDRLVRVTLESIVALEAITETNGPSDAASGPEA